MTQIEVGVWCLNAWSPRTEDGGGSQDRGQSSLCSEFHNRILFFPRLDEESVLYRAVFKVIDPKLHPKSQ